MSVLEIQTLGAPVLRKRARAVKRVTDAERRLIDDMMETMAHAQGRGLAATQVGDPRRIIVVLTEDREALAIVNPKVVDREGEIVQGGEGCLSLPRVWGEVRRPFRVTVTGRDRNGKPLRFTGEDYVGRCLLHEIDHLDGKLFIDRALENTLAWVREVEDEETGEREMELEATTLDEIYAHFGATR